MIREPIDQLTLPIASVYGEPAERVLGATEFEAWAALRLLKCGHKAVLSGPGCRWCRGTLEVSDALCGSDHLRLLPER